MGYVFFRLLIVISPTSLKIRTHYHSTPVASRITQWALLCKNWLTELDNGERTKSSGNYGGGSFSGDIGGYRANRLPRIEGAVADRGAGIGKEASGNRGESGAGDEIRTHDFNLGKVALYP